MSANDVLEMLKDLISTVGFPIGVTIALLVHEATTQKKYHAQIEKLTQSVETLTKQLGDVLVRMTKRD